MKVLGICCIGIGSKRELINRSDSSTRNGNSVSTRIGIDDDNSMRNMINEL